MQKMLLVAIGIVIGIGFTLFIPLAFAHDEDRVVEELRKIHTELGEIKGKLHTTDVKLNELQRQLLTHHQDIRSIIESESAAIKKHIENPWVKIGDDIKEVVKDREKYEYAVYYNNNIVRVTESSWNGGYRVVTEPYMTGDRRPFQLGGAMWIWDTADSIDDEGPYHLYYYYGQDGVVASGGNGRDKATVYRRLRK